MPNKCEYGYLHEETPCVYCERDILKTQLVETITTNNVLQTFYDRIKELENTVTGLKAEIAGAHGALKLSGVPEQIPPFKVPLAPLAARIMYLKNHHKDEVEQLRTERDRAHSANKESNETISELKEILAEYDKNGS